MIKNMRGGLPNLFKSGSRQYSGLEETVLKNIQACKDLANITRTSFGPNGLNKMVINHLEKLFVTSDSATIVKELDVFHPAAKMVALAASMQEQEIGDGSNFVIMLIGELCQMAEELIEGGVHTKDIVNGYSMALKKALTILEDLVVEDYGDSKTLYNLDLLVRAIRPAISSKLYGYEEFLAPLIGKACMCAIPRKRNDEKVLMDFNVDNVRVCKVVGGQIYDCEVVSGMIIDSNVAGTIHKKKDAKIGVFTCSIDSATTETKGTVLIHDADELMSYNTSEEKMLEETIRGLYELGCSMIVSGSNIGDVALHFLEKYNIMALKVSSKFALRRICRSVKARPIVQFGPNTMTKEDFGFCPSVYVREVGSKKITVFENSDSLVSTILVRGSTRNIVDNIERAIDDGVNTVKSMYRDPRFLPGAGAVEIELGRRLRQYGSSESSLAQYSINKFAEALEIVPRVLAYSSGMNHTTILSDLIASHNSSDAVEDEKSSNRIGVDIENNGIMDVVKQNPPILDLLTLKKSALKLATEAAVTILRIDQMIMSKPAGGPKVGQKHGH